MDRMVTDLLEVARLARGRFELARDPVDLAELSREVVGWWTEHVAEDARHRIELEAPATLPVTGDRARLEQALGHLVGNAVKFSPDGGVVHVRVEGDGEAVMVVRDAGIGIAAADLPRVGTEPFVRAKRAKTYAGVGVGLYLARRIAEGHGGRLEVTSAGEGKGTTVRLILPR